MNAPAKITDFASDLAASHEATFSEAVLSAVKSHFPNMLKVIPCHQKNDRMGADAIIELHGEKPVLVDFKIRSRDFAKDREDIDLAIELTSGSNAGWALKETLADFYMFVCLDTGRSACFETAPFKQAVERHHEAWSAFCKAIDTYTAGRYGNMVSRAVIVPACTVQKAIDSLDWGA